jgi:hypothetical protein
MLMKRLVSTIIMAAVISAVALVPATVLAANANGNHNTYAWVIGATTPSDTAMAPDGSTITMAGSGTLTVGPGKIASGGGTFMTSGGASGTWTSTAVEGFVSYGPAGAGFPPGFTGGEAKLKISLSNGEAGVLTIICVLGSPPAGKMEGINVVLGAGVSGEYTKSDGGNNVFILEP